MDFGLFGFILIDMYENPVEKSEKTSINKKKELILLSTV